ncbi:MAG: hypothetical protein UZ15_CFX003000581 [Chloroflexi bacterium OLB15]|nr:MAG: hypothetical protein UZ15_CFX003000581 [Chloroflexi bacterium OLB15]
MSAGGLIAAILLVTAAALIIALPFLSARRKAAADGALLKQQDRVIAYYERALQNIRDLDEDHALGKINEESYRQDRELWAQRGAQALKLLDQLTVENGHPADSSDDVIEQMVAQSREKQAASTTQAQP